MRTASRYAMVFVTAPDLTVARRLVREALAKRVVACGNLIRGIESHYWWKGKLEQGREVLILFKTTQSKLKALESVIKAHHPYETPEILAVPLKAGSDSYLSWISESVGVKGTV